MYNAAESKVRVHLVEKMILKIPCQCSDSDFNALFFYFLLYIYITL